MCHLNIHRVQYRFGLKTSVMYWTMVHSSCNVKGGLWSLYWGFLNHSRVNSRNRYACSSNSTVEFQCALTSRLSSTAICVLMFDSQWTHSNYTMSAESIQQAFTPIWRTVSALSNCLEINTFSIIFAKHGLMADSWLILALASFLSLCLFPMSMLSFCPNCRLHAWASQDLVLPVSPKLLIDARKASWMMCTMHHLWFLNAGHPIPEASIVVYSSWVIE